jgi:16S rRNA (adenine1518-N6/adenine1519-N6)-dimethyltransferase
MFAIDTAKRFLAKPSTRDYSSATIFVTSFYEIKKVAIVKKANFFPVPKVDSMVIKFVSKKGINKEYLKEFNLFVQRLFFYRRKTILNSLSQNLNSKSDSKAILDQANIDNNRRIETLNIEELNNLYESFKEYK